MYVYVFIDTYSYIYVCFDAGARETPEWSPESLHSVEDHQDFAAKQAVQTAHALHHADRDHPRGPAGSDDSVSAAEAGLWNQGPGIQLCSFVSFTLTITQTKS